MVIRNTKQVGKYRSLVNRPIVVEFLHKDDVDYVVNNRRYLPEGVYVDREYTKETEEKRRELKPYLRAARHLPKYQRKCRLEGDALIILGTSYRTNDLEKLPQELHGENISCVPNRESYEFFGKLHPFSNFYATNFNFQGYEYHSSEQMIQHLKASYFGDEETAQKILNASSAFECKRLSKEIADYNHKDWCSIAKNMCESGIKVKFDQNPVIKKKLLATKGKHWSSAVWIMYGGLEYQ